MGGNGRTFGDRRCFVFSARFSGCYAKHLFAPEHIRILVEKWSAGWAVFFECLFIIVLTLNIYCDLI